MLLPIRLPPRMNVFAGLCLLAGLVGGTHASASSVSNGLIVLIPGTGNSLVPSDAFMQAQIKLNGKYFSKIILDTLAEKGFETFIPVGLDPFGDIAENGRRVYAQLADYYQTHHATDNTPIILIGHSAGGLYGLKVLEINENLPIQKLVLFSTPLEGSRFSDILFGHCQGRVDCNIVQSKLTRIAKKLGLDALEQLRKFRVREFLDGLMLPANVEIYAVAGTQSSNYSARPGFICPLCVSSELLYGGESDGVISLDSAYGAKTFISDRTGAPIIIKPLPNLHVFLGHHEQVAAESILRMLGQRNIGWVKEHQKRLFAGLADFFLLH